MPSKRRRPMLLAVGLVLLGSIFGCTTGPMNIQEAHYFAVTNGENTNYYRLRVDAQTRLGVAGYRSGWFPARAVDMLFGETSAESGAAALEVRSQLESQINSKILSTTQAWLEEAAKPDPDPALLARLNQARRLVLAYPTREGQPFRGSMDIEYNPTIGVAVLHADEKLVFVLASNPDEVIAKIGNFVEDDKTVLVLNRFSDMIAQRSLNDIATQEASLALDEKANAILLAQIRRVLGLGDTIQLVGEIDGLLAVIDSLSP